MTEPRRLARAAALLAASVLLACASAHPAPIAVEEPPLLQLPADVRPVRYALELEVAPGRERFRGRVAIDVDLERPRRTIWLHGRELHVTSATAQAAGGPERASRYAQVTATGVARLDVPVELGPGRATLRLTFDAAFGEIFGLYQARSAGIPYAATQLEAVDARRAFPCFDEPAFKTPFEVTVVAPAAEVVVSNTREVERAEAGRGMQRVRFAPTRPLPTYLVFVAVGPFEVVAPPPLPPTAVRSEPLPVRGLAPRGRGSDLGFALDAGAPLLLELESYFGIGFPYGKLDQIALPDFLYGGMENAGAIAYADAALLAPPSRATDADRRRVAYVVAHEMAHQWFGDLVTLRWWTDAWLNESFATWMGRRVVARWRPEWHAELTALRDAEGAKQEDALASARAIRQPLARVEEVWDQFDGMSYAKGGAVLAMFERFVGEERFRDGIRAYVAAHADGSGSTPELLAALSRAAGRDLAAPFLGFLDQPGIPLVSARVRCDERGARLALSQTRYRPRGSTAARAEWEIPVCVRYSVAGAEHERCTLLAPAGGELSLAEGCPEWILPDAGAAGYYRAALSPTDVARLRPALARLSPAERVGLVHDLVAAQRAGVLAYGDALPALLDLARDADGEVSGEVLEFLTHARDDLVPAAARAAVEAVARRGYRPALDRLGWTPRPGEPSGDTRLRPRLVSFLALTARDPEILAEAARRGLAYAGLEDGRAHPEAIAPDLVEPALSAAVDVHGAPVVDALVARLGTEEDGATRRRILLALSHARDPAAAARVVALWRDDRLRPSERFRPLDDGSERPGLRDAVLDEISGHAAEIVARLPGETAARLPLAAAGQCDAASARRLREAAEPLVPAHPELRRALSKALERIALCAAERDADGAAAARAFEAAARAP